MMAMFARGDGGLAQIGGDHAKPHEYNRLIQPVNRMLFDMVNRWLQNAQDWLMPAQCELCGGLGQEGRNVCVACRNDMPALGPACRQCAVPLPAAGLCGICQRHPRPFVAATAAFLYQPPLDSLIQRLKFPGDLRLARLLGELMAEGLCAQFVTPLDVDVMLPVPLHAARLRERGFNQALELARPLARCLNLPLDTRCAERVRATVPQSGLPAKLRRRNIKGAFRVTAAVAGRRIAVVDDVMTTGHTVSEFAATLRRAGAVSVTVWLCARVPR